MTNAKGENTDLITFGTTVVIDVPEDISDFLVNALKNHLESTYKNFKSDLISNEERQEEFLNHGEFLENDGKVYLYLRSTKKAVVFNKKTEVENDLKIVTPNDVLQEFSAPYNEVAKIMRKYPKVFEIKDTEEEGGVHGVMHLGALTPLLEKVNGSQK